MTPIHATFLGQYLLGSSLMYLKPCDPLASGFPFSPDFLSDLWMHLLCLIQRCLIFPVILADNGPKFVILGTFCTFFLNWFLVTQVRIIKCASKGQQTHRKKRIIQDKVSRIPSKTYPGCPKQYKHYAPTRTFWASAVSLEKYWEYVACWVLSLCLQVFSCSLHIDYAG